MHHGGGLRDDDPAASPCLPLNKQNMNSKNSGELAPAAPQRRRREKRQRIAQDMHHEEAEEGVVLRDEDEPPPRPARAFKTVSRMNATSPVPAAPSASAAAARRRGENSNSILFFSFVALTLLLCGSAERLAAAVEEAARQEGQGGNLKSLSDFLSAIYGGGDGGGDEVKVDADGKVELTAEQLNELISQYNQQQQEAQEVAQQSEAGGGGSRKEWGGGGRAKKTNRRKVLFDLSVRGHYGRLLDLMNNNVTSSSAASEMIGGGVDGEVFDYDPEDGVCEHYNERLKMPFDLRELAASSESVLRRADHWTFRLCPRGSLSQVHVVAMAVSEDATDGSDGGTAVMKLPSTSVLAGTIQLGVPASHDLGTYLPPSTAGFDTLVRTAWGANEDVASGRRGWVEYYRDGDACGGTRKRQSKVEYDRECCARPARRSVADEFFGNGGRIMVRSASEPEPCRYVVRACRVCDPVEDDSGAGDDDGTPSDEGAEPSHPAVDPSDFTHLVETYLRGSTVGDALPPMPPSQIEANKDLVRSMFGHAFDNYFHNAFPASELRPLTCTPGTFDLVKVPALTLIDTLDAFIIMGNYTEFARSVERLRYLDVQMKGEFREALSKSAKGYSVRKGEEGGLFSVNQNVSVFETTIRVLGGLLSAHQLAVAFMSNLVSRKDVWDSVTGDVLNATASSGGSAGGNMEGETRNGGVVGSGSGKDGEACAWESAACPGEGSEPDLELGQECSSKAGSTAKRKNAEDVAAGPWEYDGFLLELAHDMGKRLLFAFDTDTGIPYGTVNLLQGVPPGETTVASLAGAGTLSLEFELLSRLTGDPSFGNAAKLATRALWVRGSQLNLYGKHIDTQSGKWKEHLSGVGSNSDSFYEYLMKHYVLFPDDSDFWSMFVKAYAGVHDNSRLGEWYVDVDIGHGLSGHVRQVFESLMAFYPGLQVLLGEVAPSAKSLNSFFLVREFLGLLPERFDFVHWKAEGSGDVHPLRPELLESCYFLHLASLGLHGSRCGPCSNTNSSQHTSGWLWAADFALHTVHKLAWTPCGFATVTKVSPTTTGGIDFVGDPHRDPQAEQRHYRIKHHNEMPSFFLSETLKYLWLTFDAENNILHNDEREWIFTTEAHPIHYVPRSNSTFQGDDHLHAQIDQVRSLLEERLSTASPPALEYSATSAFSAESEQWSKRTRGPDFKESLSQVDQALLAAKGEASGDAFYSGPSFHRTTLSQEDVASYGIFSSEVSSINLAHHKFDVIGKGSGNRLARHCPNIYHPDLQWVHALHGDALDYDTGHSSSMSRGSSSPNVDERMLTALASAAFYGTDYYPDGIAADESETCRANEEPKHSSPNPKSNSFRKMHSNPTATTIPGATRYDMKNELGAFDVSSFPGGDGFVVRHVNSQELLEVSIFPEIDPDDSPGAVVLAVLTTSTRPSSSPLTQNKLARTLEGRSLSSWRSSLSSLGHESVDESPKEQSSEYAEDDEFRRNVVVADMNGNSFKCEVVLTRTDDETEIATFPCAPAFFGKASMPVLRKNGGEYLKGKLSPPPPDDELGCKPHPQLDQEETREGNDRGNLQIVRRGDCNFQSKAANYQHVAEALIVVNTNPSELFVMSGDKTVPGPDGFSSDDLPVSVLVSGQDGDAMVQVLRDEESRGNEVDTVLHLMGESDEEVMAFPHVKGSMESLQVLAQNGWGITAVPYNQQNAGWQLFITQHDKS